MWERDLDSGASMSPIPPLCAVRPPVWPGAFRSRRLPVAAAPRLLVVFELAVDLVCGAVKDGGPWQMIGIWTAADNV